MNKKKKIGLQQCWKILCLKGHYQENKKTAHGIGENIFKLYIWYETCTYNKEFLELNSKKDNPI